MPMREVYLEAYNPELHGQKLRDWLGRPHVSRWWGDPELAFEDSQRRSRETCAVINVDGAPVGYLCWQRPTQDELEIAGLADLPKELVDIDVLIGELEVIDQGVGSRSLGLLLERLREDPVVSFAGIGTSVSNKRAIRAFEKTGYRLFREFQDLEFGSCVYMVVEVRGAV